MNEFHDAERRLRDRSALENIVGDSNAWIERISQERVIRMVSPRTIRSRLWTTTRSRHVARLRNENLLPKFSVDIDELFLLDKNQDKLGTTVLSITPSKIKPIRLESFSLKPLENRLSK